MRFAIASWGKSRVSFRIGRQSSCTHRSVLLTSDTRRHIYFGARAHSGSTAHISDFLHSVVPPLDGSGHKGQAGRIGVLGGSINFAGAPFYAGMSALRIGAELIYIFAAEEATGPIKSFSPELMVFPVYRHAVISDLDATTRAVEQHLFVERMKSFLPRLHALCIGPGLGREPAVLDAVADVIEAARIQGLPLVIDADGLWLISQRPALVEGYRNVVLTPNKMEYKLLAAALRGDESIGAMALSGELNDVVVLQKGVTDRICTSYQVLEVDEPGTPKRPGGLGDILCGSLATVSAWAMMRSGCRIEACRAASVLVRRSSRKAFMKHKRAMVAPDVISELGPTFEEVCPAQ